MQAAAVAPSLVCEETTPPPLDKLLEDAELPPFLYCRPLSLMGEDSDSDARKVPDMAGRVPTSSAAGSAKNHGGRKRTTLPAEKEHKRMKRLLRNRVSAQQARERKKAYVTDLEARMKEIELRNAELEEKVSTLQQENSMLRKIIRSTAIRNDNPGGMK